MHGCYRMSLLGAMCKLLAGLLPVKNAANLVRRNGGVQVECPEQGGHITFVQGEPVLA